jgi:hypothetical protein
MKTILCLLLTACIGAIAMAQVSNPFALRAVAGFTIATVFFFALLSLHKGK